MEEEYLIDPLLIDKYCLEDDDFECPVCEQNYKASILNNHYKQCYFDYIKKVQDETNKRNKEIEEENNNNYYESIFKYLFEQLESVKFSEVFMNKKLEFIDLDFENTVILMDNYENNYENMDEFDNVIIFDKYIEKRGLMNTYLINNNNEYDYSDYNEKIIYMNNENLYSNKIRSLLKNSDNNELIYFANVNIINFISKLLNIDINSKLIFILYLIKISKNKITIIDDKKFNFTELIFINHLERLNYINYIDKSGFTEL